MSLRGNYAGFFWGGICFLCIIYTYFRVPEPRGRTFAELDLLFERGVPARKFNSYQIDVFADDAGRSVGGEQVQGYEEMEKRGSVVV